MQARTLSSANYNRSTTETYNRTTRSSRRARKRAARNRARIAVLVFTAVLFFMIGFFAAGFRTDAADEFETARVYTSITVKSGDSLWTIASDYAGFEFSDTREFVSEVKKLNHLSSDEIHAGEHLVIPYVKTIE